MTAQRRTAVFIRPTTTPPANVAAAAALEAAMPEVDFVVLDVASRLKRRRHVLALCALSGIIRFGPDLLRRRIGLRGAVWRSPALQRWLTREVENVASAEGAWFTIQMQSLFDGGTTTVPHFVYTDHTNLENARYPARERRRTLPHWAEGAEGRIYHRAQLVFTRSSNVTNSVVRDYAVPEERVQRVGAGANVWPTHAHRGGSHPHDPTVLFVGRDWSRKGGPELVAAMRALRSAVPNARLLVVGCEPRIDDDFCEVAGPVDLDQLSTYYNRASVFALPSRREPFGVAAVEAMAHGLPVVATRLGSFPDIVDDGITGFLVEAEDSAGLSDALKTLLLDPQQARQMGGAARRRAAAEFKWSVVAERIAAGIRSGLSEPQP